MTRPLCGTRRGKPSVVFTRLFYVTFHFSFRVPSLRVDVSLALARQALTFGRDDRYDEIYGKLSPFLKGSGYNLKTDVVFIPISGFTGANLKDPIDRAIASWVECA